MRYTITRVTTAWSIVIFKLYCNPAIEYLVDIDGKNHVFLLSWGPQSQSYHLPPPAARLSSSPIPLPQLSNFIQRDFITPLSFPES